ncbi:MAG: hypothetical protein IJ779_02540 [Ruminococcus sp.]|nr:hypothetical protein [Ruminococcus sp.]
MGDLEFHYQKLEEAKQAGIEEGKKQAEEEKGGDGDITGLIVLIAVILCILAFLNRGSSNVKAPPQSTSTSYTQSAPLPDDIGDYVSSSSTHFYKYLGSDGVTYVRHHFEPTEELSRQGYYKCSTGEYILLTMNFSPQNGQWLCSWRITYSSGGGEIVLSNGADIVSVKEYASQNCLDSLSQALNSHGFDPCVIDPNGTAITCSEGKSLIGFQG